ncbi:TBKB1 protein, partial [Ibidorhyncha struthersii]|nr:TBKB1 protein [Ibidorhyncha struthersii]
MDSMFEDDISILTQEALAPDEDWLDSPNTDLSGEMCSASHFALITAYDDIKNRLTGLERENSTLKRRLKMYEVKVRGQGGRGGMGGRQSTGALFPPIPEQRALVETHLNRIRSLEQQLRQRDGSTFPGLGTPLPGQEVPFLTLHPNPSLTHGELHPHHHLPRPTGPPRAARRGLSRALPAAELEAARQETQRAQHREEHLKAECERLQAELKHLQDTREQDQSERDMAWVKKVGDDQ